MVSSMTNSTVPAEGVVLSDMVGIKITLFPNRVEYSQKIPFSVRNQSIMLRAITEVRLEYKAGIAKGVVYVLTSDGKTHQLPCGKNAPAVQAAIMDAV